MVDGRVFCDSRIKELKIVDPVVTSKDNTAGSFVFSVPPTHPKKDTIKRKQSVVSVFKNNEENPRFQGLVVEEDGDFDTIKTYTCEGELSYLNDSIQRPARYQGVTPRELLKTYLENHNSQVEPNKRFELGVVTVEDPNNYIYCYTNMNSTMQEIKEDLIDNLGGHLRVRYENGKRYLDYLKDSPRRSNQVIELGVNLTNYNSNIDDTELATVIVPLGALTAEQTIEGLDTRLTIASVNDGKDYLVSPAQEVFGTIQKVVTWDGVSTPSILKQKGEKYIADTQFENVVVTVTAIDMGDLQEDIDCFSVLDDIRIKSKPHGMDRYFMLTKQVMYLNEPDKDTVTLGKEERLSLTSRTNAVNSEVMKAIANIVPSTDIVQMAVEQASAMIAGAKGGSVVIDKDENNQPYRILVMDVPEKELATNIIQINKNGIGFSNSGIDGPYRNAFAIDGHLVADFIAGGTITTSSFIQQGSVTKYASDYTYDDIDVLEALRVGSISPTKELCEKFDFDGDMLFNGYDKLMKLVEEKQDVQIQTNLTISPRSQTNIIETDGVVIGRKGIAVEGANIDELRANSILAKRDGSGEYQRGVTINLNLGGVTLSFASGILVNVY